MNNQHEDANSISVSLAGLILFIVCASPVSQAEFSFAVFGDMQASDCSDNGFIIRQIQAMAQANADFNISLGDLIAGYTNASCFAGNGSCAQSSSAGSVNDNLSPLIKTPRTGLSSSLFLVIGNHDDGWGSGWYPDPCGGGICDVIAPAYINHGDTLRSPGFFPHNLNHGDICSKTENASGHGTDYYYSFTYQNSYFIVLHLNSDYTGMFDCNNLPSGFGSCDEYCSDTSLFLDNGRNRNCYNVFQYDWLLSELRKAAAYQHVFVFAHAPLLTSSDNHAEITGAPYYRKALEKASVDIYFNGHNHAYERTVPVRGSSRDSNGVIYLTVGPAGAKTDGISGSWFTAASYSDWTDGNQEEQSGYMLVTVRDNNDVYAERRGIANTLQDSFTVVPHRTVISRKESDYSSSKGIHVRYKPDIRAVVIDASSGSFSSMEILSLTGRKVMHITPVTGQNQHFQVPLTNEIASGIYLVMLHTPEKENISIPFMLCTP